jgi:hypothetical protein
MFWKWVLCLINSCTELAAYSKKSTISSREIQTAVRLILPGELSKHAISEGTKSVTKVCTPVRCRCLKLIVIFTVLECGGEVDFYVYCSLFSSVFLLYCRGVLVLTGDLKLTMSSFDLIHGIAKGSTSQFVFRSELIHFDVLCFTCVASWSLAC